MNNEAEKRIAAKLAKTMAMLCVRNTHLETLHAGKTPETKAGDWSDVTVVDAYGQHIAWTDVSRISDKESGITLAGIDSVNCPRPRRVAAWAQLAKEIDLAHLEMIVEEIGLAGVISAASELIEGKRRGRIVVDVNR